MELLIGDRADYFSSPQEAIEKISFYKENHAKRKEFLWNNRRDEDAFTSKRRISQLMILCDRYLKEGSGSKWNKIPQ